MKLSTTKHELQRGLGRIQAIVEKRNTMPILANVLLRASKKKGEDGGTLELAATDLEVGIRSVHPVEVSTPGEVTVSAKKLYEIVRELPEEPIHLEVTENSYVILQCARAKFSLAGSAAEEYPKLPEFAPGKMALLQSPVLAEMIARTMYAASTDETRYNLNGVFLEQRSDRNCIRMVATDGPRLAYVDRELDGEIPGLTSGVIIPRKGLTELKRLVDEEDSDEVEIGFEGNSGLVRKGGVTLVMRLIEGEFPNYSQVIPEKTTQTLILPVDALNHALRRVAILSAERSRAIKFELDSGLLSLSSNNPDIGDAREELDVDYAGEKLSIAFNARYLMDAVSSLGSKEVRLSFQDGLSPVKLVPTEDNDTLAVVMPMRI